MAVYTGKQLAALFEAIQDVYQSADATGCDGDLTVVAQSSVLAMKQRMDELKKLDQAFVLGVHTHRHGDSSYNFLVPRRADGTVAFNKDDLENFLQEEFEPDREEFLNVIVFDDEPTIVMGDHPEHAALIEAADIHVGDDPEVPGGYTWVGCEQSFASRGALLPAGWQDEVVPQWRIESDAMCASVLDQDGDRVCYCDSGDAEYDERNAKMIVRAMQLLPHFARLADFVETVAMGNTDIENLERTARELEQDLSRLVEAETSVAQSERPRA